MEAPSSPSLVIHDPEAAEMLLEPESLRHLFPFLGRECSVREAAAQLKEKPNSTLARVRRFLRLGLLHVTRELPRRGRAVKLYRTTADVFFVPFEATRAETLELSLTARDEYLQGLLRQSVVRARLEEAQGWGTRIYRDDRGRLQVQAAINPDSNQTLLHPDAPAVLSVWREAVYLDFEDAKRLQHELFALFKRYNSKEGAQRYILRLGLAPLGEDDG